MRGWFREQNKMFSYVRPEQRIPADHPLRAIRELTWDVLKSLSPWIRNYGDVSRGGNQAARRRGVRLNLASSA